jgi:hypothetical protein
MGGAAISTNRTAPSSRTLSVSKATGRTPSSIRTQKASGRAFPPTASDPRGLAYDLDVLLRYRTFSIPCLAEEEELAGGPSEEA